MSRQRYVHIPSGRVVTASQIGKSNVYCGEPLVPSHAKAGDWWVEVDRPTYCYFESKSVGRGVYGTAQTRVIVSAFTFDHEFEEQGS